MLWKSINQSVIIKISETLNIPQSTIKNWNEYGIVTFMHRVKQVSVTACKGNCSEMRPRVTQHNATTTVLHWQDGVFKGKKAVQGTVIPFPELTWGQGKFCLSWRSVPFCRLMRDWRMWSSRLSGTTTWSCWARSCLTLVAWPSIMTAQQSFRRFSRNRTSR